jgi:diguanylate cyclase (GGDEF)-like protein
MIDIDHFKRFNDAYGHQAGDDCLQKVAEALAETIKRPTDLVARFGGEEFALVLGGTSSAGARSIAEQAVENVRQMKIIHKGSETSPFLTVSVGIATALPDLEMSEIELIRNADRALYKAKESGRDCMFFHDHLKHGPLNADVLAQDHFVTE